MSDTKTVVGTCSGITEKSSGWTEFEIQVEGNQYPTRLATKLQELIAAARALEGGIGTWTYNEVQSDKTNPHSGKPYVNRYLEKVEAGASSNGGPEAQHAPIHYADKDRAITRMACLKAAAQIAGGLPYDAETEDLPVAVMRAAGRFERWIYRDIDPLPSEPEHEAPDLSEHDQAIPF